MPKRSKFAIQLQRIGSITVSSIETSLDLCDPSFFVLVATVILGGPKAVSESGIQDKYGRLVLSNGVVHTRRLYRRRRSCLVNSRLDQQTSHRLAEQRSQGKTRRDRRSKRPIGQQKCQIASNDRAASIGQRQAHFGARIRTQKIRAIGQECAHPPYRT